jgi:hypothetical protein
MASLTKKTRIRRKNRKKNMGKRRKAVESVSSTPSDAELFAALGEPGQPAPPQKSQ